MSRLPTLKLFLIPFLLPFTAACAPGPVPISQSPHDPSNPSAAEGHTPYEVATRVPSSTAEPKPGAPAPIAHEHHEHAAAGAVYSCPMHPDVTSDKPGDCPKCGMHLVPKK